ncbi:carboxymuconolactone decarboxylase family protein [Deinococcus aestuarii]|uniref:carboxymuconolactone decarboxylase family protein n=1 Tax=Deinococcus aestuarii TaxID=2774531 RepID=UPI001C0CD4ED|nr:carboxymuconolactone decarboxylase family protein [Deinococcus aestuarii]
MSERMKNPALRVPGAMPALLDPGRAAQGGLPAQLRDLINLRASQINRCSACVISHCRDLKQAGETDDRLFAVGAWRDTPYFTDAERAALALTEAASRQTSSGTG